MSLPLIYLVLPRKFQKILEIIIENLSHLLETISMIAINGASIAKFFRYYVLTWKPYKHSQSIKRYQVSDTRNLLGFTTIEMEILV